MAAKKPPKGKKSKSTKQPEPAPSSRVAKLLAEFNGLTVAEKAELVLTSNPMADHFYDFAHDVFHVFRLSRFITHCRGLFAPGALDNLRIENINAVAAIITRVSKESESLRHLIFDSRGALDGDFDTWPRDLETAKAIAAKKKANQSYGQIAKSLDMKKDAVKKIHKRWEAKKNEMTAALMEFQRQNDEDLKNVLAYLTAK